MGFDVSLRYLRCCRCFEQQENRIKSLGLRREATVQTIVFLVVSRKVSDNFMPSSCLGRELILQMKDIAQRRLTN